jgi:hypothetical protein
MNNDMHQNCATQQGTLISLSFGSLWFLGLRGPLLPILGNTHKSLSEDGWCNPKLHILLEDIGTIINYDPEIGVPKLLDTNLVCFPCFMAEGVQRNS